LAKELIGRKKFYEEKNGYTVLTEIYVTNKHGVIIASTGRTSDYLQADEEWYKKATGEKDFWIGEVEYDESSDTYAMDIVINLYDDNGNFAGILKSVLNIEESINIIKEIEAQSEYKTTEFKLIDKNGKIIYSTGEFEIFENISNELSSHLKESKGSHREYAICPGDKPEEGKELVVCAHSKGYRDYKGLDWILITEQETEEIFTPVLKLRNYILITLLAITVLAILVGFSISNSIYKPVAKLKTATIEIGKGNLNTSIDIKSNDEIGQLAISFNRMTENLTKVTATRDELNAVNQQLQASEQQLRAINQQIGASDQQLRTEITERKKTEKKLRENRELLKKQTKELDGALKEAIKSREIMVSMLEDNNKAREELERKVKERTKELVEVNKYLDKASQAKSEFLANMSHELRTPLNAVIGFAEVLQDKKFGSLNEKQARYVNNISTSGTHLLGLINDILDLSKIESGKMTFVLSEFSFPKLIKDIKVILKELAFKKNIILEDHISPEISIIKADEKKIKQIMYNLLSNAIKFTPKGGKINIKADIKDKELKVSVTDTGIGIKEKNTDKLFKTFQQIDNEYTRKYGGTGLGLALTKRLVELHGGKIWIESQFGKGSIFTFTILLIKNPEPRRVQGEAEDRKQRSKKQKTVINGSPEQAKRAKGKTEEMKIGNSSKLKGTLL
jgi:signal transduction histidine kinase